MIARATRQRFLIFALFLAAGPLACGDSSGPTTAASTSQGPTGTASETSTTTSTSTTATTATTAGTDPSTSTAETSDSGSSTGAPACEGIIGSQDCAALAEVSIDLTLETCELCQGLECGMDDDCDVRFPCVDGSILIQGCCEDRECEGVSLFCGMFTGVNNVCVDDDDV